MWTRTHRAVHGGARLFSPCGVRASIHVSCSVHPCVLLCPSHMHRSWEVTSLALKEKEPDQLWFLASEDIFLKSSSCGLFHHNNQVFHQEFSTNYTGLVIGQHCYHV